MEEIWIKVLEETARRDVMNFIMSLNDNELGNIPVFVYCAADNTHKRLPFAYACAENAVGSLRRKFGDDCVKLVTRRTTDNSLERIADALEGIQKSLDKLTVLSDCISETQTGKQFCAVSQVLNYDPCDY